MVSVTASLPMLVPDGGTRQLQDEKGSEPTQGLFFEARDLPD
jgi:hypothetical protein